MTSRTRGDKAEAILDGAMHQFMANGYAATSMDQVATAAGVSKATVYSHFQDKASLFAALIQKMAAKKLGVFFDLTQLHRQTQNPTESLTQVACSMLDTACTDEQSSAFMRLIVAESQRFPELATTYVENVAKPVISQLTQFLDSHPQLHLNDPEATARILIGSLVYYIILEEILGGKQTLHMERDRLVSTLVENIVQSAS
jgi:AcrR family transcriptional regulator